MFTIISVTGYFLLHFLPKIIVFETSTKPEGFVMILALAVSAGYTKVCQIVMFVTSVKN